MFRKERKIFTAAVVAGLLLVPLGAAEAAGGGGHSGADLWSQLLGWVRGAWMVVHFEEGSSIDPDGRPRAAAQAKDGSQIDPFGRPAAAAQTDDSSQIDPNGRH